jgi:hypothetical protein
MPDASGFAALACNEMLVHTSDVAAGFGTSFERDAMYVHAYSRACSLAPHDEDSWKTLRWGTVGHRWGKARACPRAGSLTPTRS